MVYVTILDVTLVMAGIGILENAGFQKSCYLQDSGWTLSDEI